MTTFICFWIAVMCAAIVYGGISFWSAVLR